VPGIVEQRLGVLEELPPNLGVWMLPRGVEVGSKRAF
jgi:hypothetical protein